MVNPVTVNAGIIVPLTGADVDLWGENDVNPNMVAIDGLFCGVQTISVTNLPVTLTKPAGFTATPSPGPTQSQNRVLKFTGVMTGDVRVTLPLPGVYVIDNRCTGVAFALTFQGVTATEVIGVPQGSCTEIYNDGANVRFVNLGKAGDLEFWGAKIAMPPWVNQCTVKPFLWADGSIYNASDFPGLFNEYGGNFGGNGITTFGVQDLSGRVPLAYDKTGTRITVAGCGINGQTMGVSLDKQTNVVATTNLPPQTPTGTVASHVDTTGVNGFTGGGLPVGLGGTFTGGTPVNLGGNLPILSAFTGTSFPGQNSTPVNNVQPSQVAGIWVVKT